MASESRLRYYTVSELLEHPRIALEPHRRERERFAVGRCHGLNVPLVQLVSKHLHVPLQSGDDRVLGDMARRYDLATYLRRLEPLGDDVNLTTDVIVGFPTEDDRAFGRTLAAVREARITKVHVFPYSPRPGTATAAADTVPPAVKKERSARLRAYSDAACLARWRAKIGHEDTVLVDRPGRGYGDDYCPWRVDGSIGSFVRVRGADVTEEGIVAA